jgi:hypothetical protein
MEHIMVEEEGAAVVALRGVMRPACVSDICRYQAATFETGLAVWVVEGLRE